MSIDVPDTWVDTTPTSWRTGAASDHVDTLYRDPADPNSQLVVIAQFCVECALGALSNPDQLVSGFANAFMLGPRLVAFQLPRSARAVSP